MSDSDSTFPRSPRFIRERFDEIVRRSQDEIVKGLFPAQGVGFIAGPSKALKTFLAIDISLRIGQGADVLGHRSHACGTIYIAAEAPNSVRKRVEAWRVVNQRQGLPFELIAQGPNLRNREEIEDLASELRIASQEMAAKGVRLGVVVIDTLAASMPGGDENAGADMSMIMSNLTWLSSEIGAFILVVTHTGKDESRGVRGWSGQFAGADCVIMLTFEEGGPLRFGHVAKVKDGEDGWRFAIRLEQVSLGPDDDGDEITSGVVAYEDVPQKGPKPRRQRPLNPSEVIVLQAVGYVTDNGETMPIPASVQGRQGWQKAVTRAAIRARALASGLACEGEKPNTVTARFARALQGIAAAGKVRIESELVWLI